ncbi:MAG: M23 family metallopeptidase [Coprobacillaceae bacterium]
MNDIDDIRKRMKKRKGVNKPLNDRNFKSVYNVMIKGMVVLLIGLSVITYVKLNPNTSIKEYILNDEYFSSVTDWISNAMLGFLPKDEDLKVSSDVMYTHVEDDYYKNNSNEVINFEKGKVIYTGTQEEMGSYIVVLFENDVQVTYSGLQEIFVSLYDTVDQGMVVGTYNEKFTLLFERLGKEISYETYLGME